jgi:hypothetical protein
MRLQLDRSYWLDRRKEFWAIPHDVAKRGGLFMTIRSATGDKGIDGR